jgi:Rad3-related DNA helicase
MAQGLSGGRNQLTRQFTSDKESVLLGTQSFWQGVDVRGDALQILYLTKIPFAVPTDPYIAGQCERIQRGGGDPFSSYTVPQAVIKFRQGSGRLIRGEEDVGVLIICDRRMATRSYGRVFLNSLPVGIERVYTYNELMTKIDRFL